MNCTFCGAPLPEGAQNCPNCGAPAMSGVRNAAPAQNGPAATWQAAPQSAPQQQATVRCTACGATLPAGTKFCSRCGASLSGPTAQEQAQARQKADAFWQDVDAKAKADKKARRKGNAVGWIIRLIGLAVFAYVIWQVISP